MRAPWLVRTIHYISIKHAPYVTRVHCWDIMHAAYVIRTSARKHSRSARAARASLHFSRVLKKFPRAYITQQCTRRVFYFFSTFREKIISVFRTIPPLKINWLITSLFPLLQSVIGLKNSRYALYQSGAKLKPIACWPLVFFHASGSLLWYFLRSNWPIWFRQRALARLTLPKRGDLNMKAIFAVINTTWTVVKTRPENNSGLYGIWTHDLYDTGAALYQLS